MINKQIKYWINEWIFLHNPVSTYTAQTLGNYEAESINWAINNNITLPRLNFNSPFLPFCIIDIFPKALQIVKDSPLAAEKTHCLAWADELKYNKSHTGYGWLSE